MDHQVYNLGLILPTALHSHEICQTTDDMGTRERVGIYMQFQLSCCSKFVTSDPSPILAKCKCSGKGRCEKVHISNMYSKYIFL